MTLVFGGVSFPLAATGNAIPQPFTDAALPYLKDAINFYTRDAFADVMRGKVSGQSDTLACQQTSIADPGFLHTRTTFRTPFLSLYAEQGTVSEGTARWDNTETRYALTYVLPPMPLDTVQEAVVPFLQAVQKLLVLLIKNGGDDSHSSGARVWDDAAIVSVRMGAWSIVAETIGDGERTVQAFPMLRAEVFVVEQEGFDFGGPTLARVDHGIDHDSEDGSIPLVSTHFTP